jgi:hypothetical protein
VKYNPHVVKRLVILGVLMATTGLQVLAQYRSEKDATIPLEHFYIDRTKSGPLRYLLSKFTFGLSTGYGRTTFKHNLDGFGLLVRDSTRVPEIFAGKSATGSPSYSRWVNTVSETGDTSKILYRFDSTKLGFKSHAFNIPIKATAHLEFDRYRVGGGYSYEYTRVGTFNPTTHKDSIPSFKLDRPGFFMRRYFGMIGGTVYKYYDYSLVVDLNIGGYKLGNQFNAAIIQKGIYWNLGATVERQMSEYFKIFVRPSYEMKRYHIVMPEAGGSITHKLNAFYINFGATYRLPELGRCFLKECHAQIDHAHGNREYRSRRHPIYKKQNPHYGENYPTLIKYKGRNKKKLNPY